MRRTVAGFHGMAGTPATEVAYGWILERCCSSPAGPMKGAFCCQPLRSCLQDGRTEALCWWPANKSPNSDAFGGKPAVHTLRCRYAVPIWSNSELECSDKVQSRTSTCTYTLLPWLFARSLLRYRRSDSACVFTCKHACTVRPPSSPTPLTMRRWHLLCFAFDFLTVMGKIRSIFLWSRQRKVHCEKWLCQSLDAWAENTRKLDLAARTITKRLASMVSTWPAGLGSCRLRPPGEQTLEQLGLRPKLENHDPSTTASADALDGSIAEEVLFSQAECLSKNDETREKQRNGQGRR
jgi:hypothetical protein